MLARVHAHRKTRLTHDGFTVLHGQIILPRAGELLAEDIDVGKSVLRPYATLTKSTDTSDVIVPYYGVTKSG